MNSQLATETNAQLVQRLYEHGFMGGDRAVFDDLIAQNYINHSNPDQAAGPQGLKQIALAMRAAFPDLRMIYHQFVSEGDKVALFGTAEGTHHGTFFGVPATGKAVAWRIMDLFRVDNGQFVEHWDVVDMLGLLQQLGVAPGPVMPPLQAGQLPKPGVATSTLAANKRAVQRFIAAYGTGDTTVLDDILAPDFVMHTPAVLRGVAEMRQHITDVHAATPDIQINVLDLLAENDKVFVFTREYGTNTNPLMGMPPTGKPFAITAMNIYRVAEDRVAERWAVVDMLGMLQQLGVLSAPM